MDLARPKHTLSALNMESDYNYSWKLLLSLTLSTVIETITEYT